VVVVDLDSELVSKRIADGSFLRGSWVLFI